MEKVDNADNDDVNNNNVSSIQLIRTINNASKQNSDDESSEQLEDKIFALMDALEREQEDVEKDLGLVSGKFSLLFTGGATDASLFRENVQAACEGGAEIVTVHGRTRKQGYRGEADWEKIAEAKSICEKFGVMVVGNGDVTSCERAARILRETNCDGVMIGRGAVQDPLL